MQNLRAVAEAASHLEKCLPWPGREAAGLVLGTGLGGLGEKLDQVVIPYSDIPGFPRSTVDGHSGELRAGILAGKKIIALSGRFHLYEGYEPHDVVMGVRVLAALGAGPLILTNAAGALNPQFDVGGLMVITDHINLSGRSPLTGANVDAWGVRFPDMSRVWSPALAALALDAARERGIRLERGVYVQVPGPQLETPAETRAYRRLGADAIGMSTVLEAIAARHMGVELLGFSCLTNKNLPDCMEEATLESVIAQANRSAATLAAVIEAVCGRLAAAGSAGQG